MACEGWDALDPSCHAEEAAQSAMDSALESFADAAMSFLDVALSWWMEIPTPSPFYQQWDGTGTAPDGLRLMPALDSIWGAMGWISAFLMILLSMIIIGRAIWNNSAGDIRNVLAMIVRYIAVVTFGVPVLWMLIKFSDSFAPWIMEQAVSGGDGGKITAESIVKSSAIVHLGFGGGILLAVLIILGAVMQVGFMLLRGVLLLILIAVWGVTAAATGSEAGMQAFKKVNAWFLAFVLYKPAAATIYALGTSLLTNNQIQPRGEGLTETGEALFQVVLAVIMIGAASLALPALIKFMSPPAGLGASSAFSGGAAVGAIATGALAIGTLGAGSAAMGAAGAAGSGGAGAAGTGSAGTGVGAGGPSAPGAGGPSVPSGADSVVGDSGPGPDGAGSGAVDSSGSGGSGPSGAGSGGSGSSGTGSGGSSSSGAGSGWPAGGGGSPVQAPWHKPDANGSSGSAEGSASSTGDDAPSTGAAELSTAAAPSAAGSAGKGFYGTANLARAAAPVVSEVANSPSQTLEEES